MDLNYVLVFVGNKFWVIFIYKAEKIHMIPYPLIVWQISFQTLIDHFLFCEDKPYLVSIVTFKYNEQYEKARKKRCLTITNDWFITSSISPIQNPSIHRLTSKVATTPTYDISWEQKWVQGPRPRWSIWFLTHSTIFSINFKIKWEWRPLVG